MTVKMKEVKKLPPNLVNCFDIILQFVLFVIFIVFFGIPSVAKYLEKETMVIESEEETNGIEAPAFTFFANENFIGWKSVGNITSHMFNIFDHCKTIGLADLETCASNDTYGLADFLKDVRIGGRELKFPLSEFSRSPLWTEDMTATPYGRHFTFKLKRTITRNTSDYIRFSVNTSSSFFYSIWVHDPNFFLINMNPFRKIRV